MSPIELDYRLSRHTLDNGMHVVINHDPTAPGEALNIWYRVGSADEQPGATGFAHLFEHLMFTGSAQVAASEHLSLLESIGGSANATTVSYTHLSGTDGMPHTDNARCISWRSPALHRPRSATSICRRCLTVRSPRQVFTSSHRMPLSR